MKRRNWYRKIRKRPAQRARPDLQHDTSLRAVRVEYRHLDREASHAADVDADGVGFGHIVRDLFFVCAPLLRRQRRRWLYPGPRIAQFAYLVTGRTTSTEQRARWGTP
jgi:phosphate uptake regulator